MQSHKSIAIIERGSARKLNQNQEKRVERHQSEQNKRNNDPRESEGNRDSIPDEIEAEPTTRTLRLSSPNKASMLPVVAEIP
jgi:hypothetical protein